ncbi:MAG: tRNA 2-thiouridine(34) synthase MnmA [Phycisphaeraceae bacterium]|nr:MAG: tRNA 2-thiouridine(34) synthase MnmA [Phycisphaeraceae bacterium]
MARPKAKVLVAMSGGVDSSVAAALLVRAGYEVVGCFMRLGTPGEELEGLAEVGVGDGDEESLARASGSCGVDGGSLARASGSCCGGGGRSEGGVRIQHRGCCSISDAADARMVAAELGVPFYVCNFKKEFGRIVDYFVAEYAAGRTPNPCVRCNDWLKFGKLHDYARQIDADFVASGHYARIEDGPDGPALLRGVDVSKDQSYVLFGAPRGRLLEMMLPVGAYEKSRVRELAQEFGLPVFDKPDSQEICFVPDDDYAGLVERRSPGAARAGAILDAEGRTIGEHGGQHRFTIGQRRGVGVAFGHPIYVVEKDPRANTITVGPREMLMSGGLRAGEVNWLVDESGYEEWRRVRVKIRYNAPPVEAQCRLTEGGETLEVRFDEAQASVAPGQAVVCYEGERVVGGGWIRETDRA